MEQLVSIILPTYNRARFLPQALVSICDQKWTNWELVIVDDGSTDATAASISRLTSGIKQPVQYIRQVNQGPGVARRTGVESAKGELIAFFDSDDYWLPEHLKLCVNSLANNRDVDWVFTASRGEDESGQVQWENSLYQDGVPRPFIRVKSDQRGTLTVLADKDLLEVALSTQFDAGFQLSVMRAHFVKRIGIPEFRIGEDHVFAAKAIALGCRLGYINQVTVIYRCHDGNISASGQSTPIERAAAIGEYLKTIATLELSLCLTPRQRKILRQRLAGQYFWALGRPLVEAGHVISGIRACAIGLSWHAANPGLWKSFFGSLARGAVTAGSRVFGRRCKA